MMIKPNSPPPDFIRLQNELRMKHNRPPNVSNSVYWGAIYELSDRLRKMFQRRFAMTLTTRRSGDILLQRLNQILHGLVDHQDVFSHGSYLLLVTQPYHPIEPEDLVVLEGLGCEVIDLEEWAWYYPGQARCYGILASPYVIGRLKLTKDPTLAREIFTGKLRG